MLRVRVGVSFNESFFEIYLKKVCKQYFNRDGSIPINTTV